MFSTQVVVSLFVHIFDIIPLFAAEFEEPKNCISGKGLNMKHLLVIQDWWYWGLMPL